MQLRNMHAQQQQQKQQPRQQQQENQPKQQQLNKQPRQQLQPRAMDRVSPSMRQCLLIALTLVAVVRWALSLLTCRSQPHQGRHCRCSLGAACATCTSTQW